MTDVQLNALKVGDVVEKKTGNQKHCYVVSYKEEKHGICLTYVDGSGYMETISYDYVDGSWVYNSKDVTQAQDVTKAQSGSIQDVLGLNSSGELVKGVVSGGTQLYRHEINLGGYGNTLYLVSNSNESIINGSKLNSALYYGVISSKLSLSSKQGVVLYATTDSSNLYLFAVTSSGSPSSATPALEKLSYALSSTFTDSVTQL